MYKLYTSIKSSITACLSELFNGEPAAIKLPIVETIDYSSSETMIITDVKKVLNGKSN